jgi:hypothetical protein
VRRISGGGASEISEDDSTISEHEDAISIVRARVRGSVATPLKEGGIGDWIGHMVGDGCGRWVWCRSRRIVTSNGRG